MKLVLGVASTILSGLIACGSATRPEPSEFAANVAPEREAADSVVFAKQVYTLDPAQKSAQAIAVSNGTIVFVGTREQAQKWIGPSTKTVEAETVVPGLVDAHAHLAGLGKFLQDVSMVGATSEMAAVEMAVNGANNFPERTWLTGRGWDQTKFANNRFPTRKSLDAAFPKLPVAFRRIDGHALWANGAALKLAGIDKKTLDPQGGKILRDRNGVPTGVLIDNAMELVERVIPPSTEAERKAQILAAASRVADLGLTGVHEMGADLATVKAYQDLDATHQLPIHVVTYLDSSKEILAAIESKALQATPAQDGQKFGVVGVKFYADGALGSRGARLIAPYSDDPSNLGLWVTEPEVLEKDMRLVMDAGFAVAVHAIGDAANKVVLDIAEKIPGIASKRLRLEHAQIMVPSDIPRMAKLGVVASMQPSHATSDMGWAEARMGKKRMEAAYAWRTMLNAKVELAFGSDFPVENESPLGAIYAGVTRQAQNGEPVGGFMPEQKLSLEETLAAFTKGAAFAGFSEAKVGQIKVGYAADLTMFATPLSENEILSSKVLATMVGGALRMAEGNH